MTFELLIIFKDGTERTIPGVTKFGINERDSYYFEKNGHKSFIPKDSVNFFGRKFDWEEGQPEPVKVQTYSKWVYWLRIDDAKCELCGYAHPMVRGSRAPDKLMDTCPSCGSKMTKQ